MATKKTGRPEGRPPIQFDLDGITALSALNCTLQEVAAFFGVSESSVDHRFTQEPELKAAWEKGRATGKLSLRRKQTELANAGNVTMLIWLGKQLLGQKDKAEVTGENGSALFDIAAVKAYCQSIKSDDESSGVPAQVPRP